MRRDEDDRATDEPARTAARLRAVFMATGGAAALTDATGRVLEITPALAAALGRPMEALLGTLLVGPGEGAALDALQRAAPWDGHVSWPGRARQLPLHLSPLEGGDWLWQLKEGDGEASGRARHLARLRAVGELAAGVAHEINTPSQFVSDNLRFLAESGGVVLELLDGLRDLERGPDAELRGGLRALLQTTDATFLREELPGAIRESGEGMARIIEIARSLKEFCHPGRERVTVDFNRVVAQTLTLSSSAYKYVADAKFEAAASLSTVRGIPGELSQVVLNLVVNAAQAIEGQQRGRGCIELRTRDGGGWIECVVDDSGPGVDEDARQRIFEPFYTTKSVGVGSGQGLALVRRIIDEHGGDIRVGTSPLGGAQFLIRLPTAQGARAPSPPPGDSAREGR